MKKLLKVMLSILIIVILTTVGGIFYITRGLNTGSRLQIGAVDMSSVSDGTYDGKYNAGRWTNELKVTVKDHKMTKIEIVKDVSIPKSEWTKMLFNKVIEKQSTDVDVISGATVTCKAYLKSIENALKTK